jgi:hypothetical protein
LGVKYPPRVLINVTIAAKPVVRLLEPVINRPTVAIYPTWRAFQMLLAAPFKLWDARPVQPVVKTILLSLYSLRFVRVVARMVWVVDRAVGSRCN